MAIGSAVLSARNVNPEVLAVGGLHDELVKVAIVLQPVEPHFWFMVNDSWFTVQG